LRPLALVQIDPRPSEVIQIPSEPKTGTGSFERLRFRSRGSVIIVGPLFSRGRMQTQTEDGQLTGDQHFRDNLLILTPLKIRTGMNCVPACPARRSDQRVQTICVSSLVGVRHNLATRGATFAGVGDAPFDHRRMEGYFQISDQVGDLCGGQCLGSGDVYVASRWSKLLHCRGGDICRVIGVSVGWAHDNSPFVSMCRNLPTASEWNILVHNFAGASV